METCNNLNVEEKEKKITKPYLDSEEFYIFLVNRIFGFL